MLLQSLMFIAIFLVFNTYQAKREIDLIELTNDFAMLQSSPIKITAFICWEKKDTFLLHKTLSKNNFLINIYNIDSKNKISFKFSAPEHHFFLLDVLCKNSIKLLNEADQMKLLSPPFKWLIFGDSVKFKKLYLGVDSKIFITTDSDDNNGYLIKSIYKTGPNSTELLSHPIGLWSKNSSFLNYKELMITRDRINLNGTLIKISYVITNLDSLNHLWDYSYRHKHIDSVSKLSYILLHVVMDMLNAKGEFIMQRTWGYKNTTTGIYSGQMGDLQLGIAEIGGTPSFFTTDRIDIVDYIAVPTQTFIEFIFRAPPLSYVANVFVLPFDGMVWRFCFIILLLLAVVIYICSIWEWRDPEFRKLVENNPQALKPNFLDVIILNFGTITQQGAEAEPQSLSGRIATIMAFLCLMALYSAYSANIVALLQSTTDSIKNLEDLLNSRLKLGAEDIVYNHYYIETAQEPIRKAIYEQKIAPKGQKPNYFTAEEGMALVQKGLFGFYTELSTAYKIVADTFQENEKCALKNVKYFNMIEPWMSVRKNSTYKEFVKVAMKRIHESGVQKRVVNKIYTRKPQCHGTGNNFGSVGLVDCYLAVLIFGIGSCLALILLFMEILFKKYSISLKKIYNLNKFKTELE